MIRKALSSSLASIVAVLAAAIWLGGIVALGAVAAPIVFSHVSSPENADAMSLVFRRFDRVAIICAALVVATEVARALRGTRLTRLDQARGLASLVAALAAVVEGVSISPRIAALHAGGAVRGINADGLELARLHGIAEALGKTEVTLLAIVIALHVLGLTAARAENPDLGGT